MCNEVIKKTGSFILSEIFQQVNEVWGTTQKIRQKKKVVAYFKPSITSHFLEFIP